MIVGEDREEAGRVYLIVLGYPSMVKVRAKSFRALLKKYF
jgi:hypothetical protein